MADPRLPSPDDEPPAIADAEVLFRKDPGPGPGQPTPGRSVDPVSGESYEVKDRQAGAPGVTPPAAPSSRPPEAAVTEVWTRTGEWGRTWLIVAAAALAVAVLVYGLLSLEAYGLAFLTLLAGGLVVAVLSYPILITLERPVRITPEQAVRDFYNALSHHAPHYRRMWLLLSDSGKYAGAFATFDGFHNYWKTRLAQLSEGRASPITPLKFEVVDFRSEKSAGKTETEADFTVQILVRGKHAEGPVESIRVHATLVKGPDRMWYLDRGTLP
jgi:hypothetical protein